MIIFMLEILAPFGFYGGEIGNVLAQWEQLGFFSYLLPFLLIFALIYGILARTNIFGSDNKAIPGIIALVIGLMALQFGLVSEFFSEIFPRLGVALVIILVALIIMGLFADPESNALMWILFAASAIVLVVVLVETSGSLGWYSSYWWHDNWPLIAGGIFILGALAIIIGASNPSQDKNKSILAKALLGDKK